MMVLTKSIYREIVLVFCFTFRQLPWKVEDERVILSIFVQNFLFLFFKSQGNPRPRITTLCEGNVVREKTFAKFEGQICTYHSQHTLKLSKVL